MKPRKTKNLACLTAATILALAGCVSAPLSQPQTSQRFIGSLAGQRVAPASTPACPRTKYQADALFAAERMLLAYAAKLVNDPRMPHDLTIQICATHVENGIVPYGRGYATVYVAVVRVYVVDARTGVLRAESIGREEYVSSGRRNFACGWVEMKRGFGSSEPRCPATLEEAFQSALSNAFQNLHPA